MFWKDRLTPFGFLLTIFYIYMYRKRQLFCTQIQVLSSRNDFSSFILKKHICATLIASLYQNFSILIEYVNQSKIVIFLPKQANFQFIILLYFLRSSHKEIDSKTEISFIKHTHTHTFSFLYYFHLYSFYFVLLISYCWIYLILFKSFFHLFFSVLFVTIECKRYKWYFF